MNQEMFKRLKQNTMLVSAAAFAVIALVLILVGILAFKVPTVAMCVLIILEAGLAIMFHHEELWLHGVLVLAQVIVGILAGKAVLVILCAVIYVAATVFLQMLDKGEKADGR